MKGLIFALFLIPVAIAAFAFGSTASAQTDPVNCDSFDSQAEAQAVLDADPGDEHGLDGDNDGIACEDLPSKAAADAEAAAAAEADAAADAEAAAAAEAAAEPAAVPASGGAPTSGGSNATTYLLIGFLGLTLIAGGAFVSRMRQTDI